MKLKYLFFIVMIVSDPKQIFGYEDYLDQSIESTTGTKRTISDWKADRKLDEIEKDMKNIIPDIKDNIKLKFYEFFEKLEELFNTKLKTTDKNVVAKLDEGVIVQLNNLEQAIDKIETNIIPALKNDINGKIDLLEKNVPKTLEEKIDIKFKALEIKLQDLENNTVLRKCKNNLDDNSEKMEKELSDIKNKLNGLEGMLNNLKDNLHCKSVTDYDLHGNIGDKLSVLESREEKILELVKKTHNSCQPRNIDQGCKTRDVAGYNFSQPYAIDDGTLKNVVIRKDHNDMYFHMNIAIMAFRDGIVRLSSTPRPGSSDLEIEIVFGGDRNKYIGFRHSPYVLYKGLHLKTHVDNVLSPARFTSFYIKLSSGKLDVGFKDQTPILSHVDDDFKSIRYINFASWETTQASFHFDCPIIE